MGKNDNFLFLFLTVIVLQVGSESVKKYEANWDSLDSRPLPKWFDAAKIGIFIHWGVFSVPSFGSEWFWINWKSNVSKYVEFMERNYPPGFSYQDFANDFTAEFFDPVKWATLFDQSGAKYVVLTSKHHEGYTLWPSKYSYSWNSQDVGPHRDLIGELSTAIQENTDLRFGLYHSLFEWFHPLYLEDKKNSFNQTSFSEGKIIPEMKELINKYKPCILWSDGDWEAPDSYWKATEFLAWLYNDSPVRDEIVTNDRWGKDIPCHHGDFYTCADRYNPGVLQKHKWENAMTIDTKSWGYRRNADLSEYMSIEKLIRTLAETVSCGGNLNMNIGPTKEGTIIPIFQERLTQMGVWLGLNGDAIYDTVPWTSQNDTIADVWYTSKEKSVYAILLTWPSNGTVTLGSATALFKNGNCRVYLMGCVELNELKWSLNKDKVDIYLPEYSTVSFLKWAWVLKIKNK